MDPSLFRKPPATLLERVVGRRRARLLRRRCGLAAFGVSIALLRPKPRYRPTASLGLATATLLGLVFVLALLRLR